MRWRADDDKRGTVIAVAALVRLAQTLLCRSCWRVIIHAFITVVLPQLLPNGLKGRLFGMTYYLLRLLKINSISNRNSRDFFYDNSS